MSYEFKELLGKDNIKVCDIKEISVSTMATKIESYLTWYTLEENQNIFEILLQFFISWVLDVEDANLLNSLSLDDQNLIVKIFLENYIETESQKWINISVELVWNVTKILIDEILLNCDVLETKMSAG